MSPDRRQKMTLRDAILLVGTAAVGMGMFPYVHRGLFQGWIWILERGLPGNQEWTALNIAVAFIDLMVFMIPLVGPWTVLLILLRLRSPRPSWRRLWRQPGVAACLAALVGWAWSAGADRGTGRRVRGRDTTVDPSRRVGAAVSLSESVRPYRSGRGSNLARDVPQRPLAEVSRLNRLDGPVVGVGWIVIGLAWTLHEYLDLF